MKQIVKDCRYLRMARIWAENSYAIRLKVGTLIVSKDGSVISDGYNGTPSGFENVCEYADDDKQNFRVNQFCKDDEERRMLLKRLSDKGKIKLITKPYVLHAEANAITKLARSTQSSDGATLYVTDTPCVECAKLIIQAGIRRVVYERDYKTTDGIDLLKRAGIVVKQISTEVLDGVNKDDEQG